MNNTYSFNDYPEVISIDNLQEILHIGRNAAFLLFQKVYSMILLNLKEALTESKMLIQQIRRNHKMTLHQLFGLCLFGGTALFLAIGSAVAYIAAHISVRLERKRAAQERIEARNRQREQEILNDMNTDYYGLRWEKKDL